MVRNVNMLSEDGTDFSLLSVVFVPKLVLLRLYISGIIELKI